MPPAAPDSAAMKAATNLLHDFNLEAFILLGIALMVTGLRSWVRIRQVGIKNLWADDYLAIIAAVFYSVETGLAYAVGNTAHGLANNSMTDHQRANLSPQSSEYATRAFGSKIQLAGWTSYSLVLWCLKGAMCTFFLRLTREIKGYRIKMYLGFGLIVASWLAAEMNLLLSCRPLHRMWQIFPDPGKYCMPATSPALIWTYLSLNVATDLYLIAIPMPMLWRAAMPMSQTLGLMALFSCGLFVTVCAILRVVLLVSDPVNGAQLAGFWAVRETFVAVITTNLPVCFPTIRKYTNPFILFVSSHISTTKLSRARTSTSPPCSITLDEWRTKLQRDSLPLSSNPVRSGSAEGIFALQEMEHLGRNEGTSDHERDLETGKTHCRTDTESSTDSVLTLKLLEFEVHEREIVGGNKESVHPEYKI